MKKAKLKTAYDLIRNRPLKDRAREYALKDPDITVGEAGPLMTGWEAGYRTAISDCRGALLKGDLFHLLRPRKR